MKLNHIKQFEEYYWNQGEDSLFDLTITQEEYIKKIVNALNIEYKTITHLADGGYGVAADLGNDTVLKITTEKSEAFYAHKLINIDSPNLIKVYKVFKVESKYQYGTLYVIHMEKLNTKLSGTVRHILNYLQKHNPVVRNIINGEIDPEIVLNFFRGKLIDLSDESILFFFNKWFDVYKECLKYDLPIDDFHSKNAGISKRSNTDLVFFDISSLYSIRENDISTIPSITLQ